MFNNVTYQESLLDNKKKLYVDCRSPSEYLDYTIPNSVNLPVLLDDERKAVGALYVDGQIQEAKKIGVSAVSKRLPKMFDKILEFKKDFDSLYFFCSRGGYRSTALVSLLNAMDVKVYKLQGGYKSYRKYVIDTLPSLINGINTITLYGYTGSGKTSILKALKKDGYNVLDLEKLANHRGSLLGQIGDKKQNSQKKFESLLSEQLKVYQNSYVFVEGESSKIGNVIVPKPLMDKMHCGVKLLIYANMEFRVNEIKGEYLPDFGGDKNLMKGSIEKLAKYISKQKLSNYLEMIEKDDFNGLLKNLCEKYYDAIYDIPKSGYVKTYHNANSIDTAKSIAHDFDHGKLASSF